MADVRVTVGAVDPSDGNDHHTTTIAPAITWLQSGANYTMGTDDIGIIQLIDAAEYNEDGLDFTGFTGTPSITSHVRLEATAGVRHDGTYNTSKARIRASGGDHAIKITENFTHIRHIAIYQNGGTSDECIHINASVDDILIEKCVLKTDPSADQDCIYTAPGANDNITVFDCAMTIGGGTGGRAGVFCQNSSGTATQTWHVEHNSINSNGVDTGDEGGVSVEINAGGAAVNMNVYNNICWGATGSAGDFIESGDGTAATWSGDGNISGDASVTTESIGSLPSKVVAADNTSGTDVQITTEDLNYQLIDGGDNGVALQAAVTGSAVQQGTGDTRVDTTTDCAGNARPATWTNRDIGAFQISAAGTTIEIPTGPLR